MSMSADPRLWQGGAMETADDRSPYGVGGHQGQPWICQESADLGKHGYYHGYGIDLSADRGSYYPDPAHALSADQSAYGGGGGAGGGGAGGAQVVPIGPAAGLYDAMSHQPSPDVDHWHAQLLAQAAAGDPFGALPIRDGPTAAAAKRKRRRVISVEQRKAANVRERRRMYQLNEAFDGLRKRVPTFAYEKKLSRIETLKLAVTYIEFMTDLLDNNGEKCKKLLENGAKRPDDRTPTAAAADVTAADVTDDDVTATTDAGGATVGGRSPSQSADGKGSRDASDEEGSDS